MAVNREYWIQIEGSDDNPWEMVPNGLDRMHGHYHSKLVFGTLKYRRYKPPLKNVRKAWEEPDDRKVNPWDMNEPHPADTRGTIPGPTLECKVGEPGVGEDIIIHFRNNDLRSLPFGYRVHSMHAHGILFPTKYDGAYPLSPPDDPQEAPGSFPDDPNNRIESNPKIKMLWHQAGAMGKYKMGDRVPPGGTFTYRWRTLGRKSTAGVWLYHDHSIHDADNVRMGAIGFLVIHDANDKDDVFIDYDMDPNGQSKDLPEGSPSGTTFYLDEKKPKRLRFYEPPNRALYLQLYHELVSPKFDGKKVVLTGKGMAINGRTFLGNAPTLVGGQKTKMMFGVGAMNRNTFHTFHIHGHRWVDNKLTFTSGSASDSSVSKFEDTRIIGPAETFHFTIEQGKELGPISINNGILGEWHMHCHVLQHMMPGGMMGSLLIIDNDHPALDDLLQSGSMPSHH